MKYIRRKRVLIYMVIALTAVMSVGCGMERSQKMTYTDTAMGTVVQQTLYVQPKAWQAEAEESLPHELMALLDSLENETLSWREETSEIYRINSAEGENGCTLTPDMQQYLEIIGDVWKKSGGALDVTVGSVTRLWDIDGWAVGETTDFKLPTELELGNALVATGFEKVNVSDGKIYLPEDINLDLGAVGKGIACDKVYAFLEEKEAVTGAVISIGGSILTYGEKPDGSSWKVAIQHPREEGESIAVLQLMGNWCVSTSGDYERYVERDGIRYHHILDPKTGYPADSGLISVTIVSESGILSDALSTACFILGMDAGLSLAKNFGAQALLIDKNLNVYMTEGMDKLLILR